MSNKKSGFGLAFMAVLWLAGCTTQNENAADPKKALNAYISRSFEIKSPAQKQDLLEYLTRDAKSRLAAWSDDQFREAFMDSKRQFIKLAFIEAKSVSPTETNVTYELSYIDQAKGHDAKVTQKKLAAMVEEQGKWRIADVQNIKELIEYRDEMSLP
jgi:hypothetical protein